MLLHCPEYHEHSVARYILATLTQQPTECALLVNLRLEHPVTLHVVVKNIVCQYLVHVLGGMGALSDLRQTCLLPCLHVLVASEVPAHCSRAIVIGPFQPLATLTACAVPIGSRRHCLVCSIHCVVQTNVLFYCMLKFADLNDSLFRGVVAVVVVVGTCL
jgi:hypothetical protein